MNHETEQHVLAKRGGVHGSLLSYMLMEGTLCTSLDQYFSSDVSGQACDSMLSRCLAQLIIVHELLSTTDQIQEPRKGVRSAFESQSLLDLKYGHICEIPNQHGDVVSCH